MGTLSLAAKIKTWNLRGLYLMKRKKVVAITGKFSICFKNVIQVATVFRYWQQLKISFKDKNIIYAKKNEFALWHRKHLKLNPDLKQKVFVTRVESFSVEFSCQPEFGFCIFTKDSFSKTWKNPPLLCSFITALDFQKFFFYFLFKLFMNCDSESYRSKKKSRTQIRVTFIFRTVYVIVYSQIV